MNKMILFIFTILILASCQKEVKNNEYVINGIIKNIPDSTVITFGDFFKPIDSALVIGEKFQFTGKIEKPENVILRIKNTRDYSELWIENSEINFVAEKGNFIDRVITGSESQKQAEVHYSRIKPLKQTIDSLYNLSKDRSLAQSNRDSMVMKYSRLMPKKEEISKKFVEEYPNCLESTKVLRRYMRDWGKELSSELFSKMNIDIKESEYGKEISHFLSLPKKPKIGEKYVDFSLENTEGKELKLSDVNAKYTLVEFWSSWCGPCRKSNSELVEEYRKFKPQGFEIIGVSLDENRENWIKAIKEDSLTWPNIIDPKGFEGDISLIYEVKGIPDNFLMDQNGIILERRLRGNKLKNKLKKMFDKKVSL